MQPQGHLQMFVRTVLWNENPQAAADAPRWRVVEGRTVAVEDAMPNTITDGLKAMGHEVTRTPPEASFSFGGAQLAWRLDDGNYVAGSDPRKDGLALGY